MHSRYFSPFSTISAIPALLATLGMISASAAETIQPLKPTYVISDGGQSRTYVVALDEVLIHRKGKPQAVQSVAGVADAPGIEAAAANLANTTGGEVRLIVYPQGAARDAANVRVVDRSILARLIEDADPNVIAAQAGLEYRGSVIGMPDYHYFRASTSARALPAAEILRARADVIQADPLLASGHVAMHVPNDPLFGSQWHLLNTGQRGGLPGVDVNITNVWDSYRGSNIVLVVMDTGTEYIQEDLIPNLLTNAALDILDRDGSADADAGENHGTAVAGVSAAAGDNNLGVSGAAPATKIIPIRTLTSGLTFFTAQDTADGLLHSNNIVDIHNNSWGPGDSALSLRGPDLIESNAFYQGVTFGRGGLGTIYVFAAGNGDDPLRGGPDANANNSGRLTSPHNIAVGALNDMGEKADYSNPGANLNISAPSGLEVYPGGRLPGTTTTDRMGTNGYNPVQFASFLPEPTNQNYTAHFNGTSSAAPLVSGGIALMLEANPNLGWRDVQEILIRTAAFNDTNNAGWITNGAGLRFNHEFGPGMMDVGAAVEMATNNYVRLGLRTNLIYAVSNLSTIVPDGDPNGTAFHFDVPVEDIRIEHVQVVINSTITVRGQIEIQVSSPYGTSSVLKEANGDPGADFVDSHFLTLRNWGEFADGGENAASNTWTVTVIDRVPATSAIVEDVELRLWGSVSNTLFVSLTNPPAILNHPLSRTATKGSDVLFGVDATGSGQLNYRWLFNGQELSGQNGPTLIVNDVGPLQQGTYHVRIDNQFGTVVSAGASLFVNSPPEITLQPTAQMANIGDSVTMNVAAVGNSPLLYQWRYNGTPIPNENSTSLTISNVQPASIGSYDVVVQNSLSSIISDLAVVSANTPVVFSGAQLGSGPSAAFMFNFSGATGMTFRIDGSIDLRTWSPLSTNTLSTGSSSFSDGAAGTFTNRYYRVVPVP